MLRVDGMNWVVERFAWHARVLEGTIWEEEGRGLTGMIADTDELSDLDDTLQAIVFMSFEKYQRRVKCMAASVQTS